MISTTPKQTGGGGFEFESKVAAYFISHLLADRPAFDDERIFSISFQTRNDGWLFDDLLLAVRKNSSDFKIAVSSKSNTQFNGNGIPRDVCRDLWIQYLNDQSTVFNKDKDFIALVVATMSKKVSKDINELLQWASANTPAVLQKRVTGNKLSEQKKKIVKSFKCPGDLAKKHAVKAADTWHLLSRLLVREFDFEEQTSESEKIIINICRQCLISQQLNEAKQLYGILKGQRNLLAPVSGVITYEKLIETIKYNFKLVGFSEHTNDWKKITDHAKIKIQLIPTQVGGQVQIDRSKKLQEAQGKIALFDTVFILGRSGAGKTSLVSTFATNKMSAGGKIVWLDVLDLEQDIETSLHLDHSISELLCKIQDPEAYIVIDGIDRLFKETHLNNLGAILSAALNPHSVWKVVCTCQTEDFEDALKRLYRNNVKVASTSDFELDLLDDEEITQIIAAFPDLVDLFKHDHLKPILSNLKYLDLMVYNSTRLKDFKSLGTSLSETDVIDWIWEGELQNGNATQASRFLLRMAEIQAQTLKASIPTSEFKVEELTPVQDLKTSKLIRENDDRLSFTHDLFGDWATYKLIRGQQDNLKTFLTVKDLLSPLWCKGIRLFGVSLLSKDHTGKTWTDVFDSFDEQTPIEKIVQDQLLESVIFFSQPETAINSLWTKLVANDGALLNRFLKIFLHRATSPNSAIIKYAIENNFGLSVASTVNREVKYLYWGPVIKALHSHDSDALKFARLHVAKITEEWLQKTPFNFPFRIECADLAVKNATWAYDTKSDGTFVDSTITSQLFKPLLAAIHEKPEEIKQLALQLCARTQPTIQKETSQPEFRAKSRPEQHKIREAKQWPHGPNGRVDEGLSEICLNGNALHSVILHSPELASEILLALLIDPPREIFFGYDHHYHYDLQEPRHWHPPFYSRGPFLTFLRWKPQHGIKVIIALVNFMTERWVQRLQEPIPKIDIALNGNSKQFLGDQSVYFWFRDGGSAPHSIVSALMALEKYLIEQIDEGKDISESINEILINGNSVAYLGLLISIGKYKPLLLLKELNCILSPLEFYIWERTLRYNPMGHHHFIGIYDESLLALAKEWHGLPHRKQLIEEVGMLLSFGHPEIRQQYETIVSQWKTRTDLPEFLDAYTQNLFNYFNPKNFSIQEQGDKILLVYNEPTEITEQFEEVRKELNEQSDIDLFAFRCYNDIKNNKTFASEELEQLWSKIQSFSSHSDENLYHFMHPKLNSMFGGILILLQNQDNWMQNTPERSNWILEFVETTVLNWHPDYDEISMHSIDYHWPQFCSAALPILWSRNIQDQRIRNFVADFALKASHDTIKRLFGATSKYLKWSDKEFIQLQNLVIERATSSVNEGDEQTRHDELKKIFVESKLALRLKNWNNKLVKDDFNKEELELPYPSYRKQYITNDPGIDDEMIAFAYSEFPLELPEGDEQEYKFAKTLWGLVADLLTFKIGEPTNDQRLGYHMNTFDDWALKRLAYLVVELKSEDKPEGFWTPILMYGVVVHEFIEPFMRHFFYFNLNRKEKYDRFFMQWDLMLEFAYNSPNWKYSRLNSHDYESVWASLIGLSNTQLEYWNGDFRDFITRAEPEFKQWAGKRVFSQHAIQRILLFIRKKSGEPFIKNGILFTSIHLKYQQELAKEPPPQGYVLVGFEHNDTLAATLAHIWEKNKSLVKNNTQLFEAFKSLVMHLVSIQNQIGLDLQERIIEA